MNIINDSTVAGVNLEDLRHLIQQLAIPEYKIVRVSDNWGVLLENGKPVNTFEWKFIEQIKRASNHDKAGTQTDG